MADAMVSHVLLMLLASCRAQGDIRAMPHAGGNHVEQHSPLEASMKQLEVHEPLLKHPPEDAGEHG